MKTKEILKRIEELAIKFNGCTVEYIYMKDRNEYMKDYNFHIYGVTDGVKLDIFVE